MLMPLLSMFAIGLSGSGAKSFHEEVAWKYGRDRFVVKVSVTPTVAPGYLRRVELRRNGHVVWAVSTVDRVRQADYLEFDDIRVRSYPIASRPGERLVFLTLKVPDWAETCVYVCGSKKPLEPWVLRYRAEFEDVFALRRDSRGAVESVVAYDKWIGGVAPTVRVGGQVLDCWEEVTKLVPKGGFVAASVRQRLVAWSGGGVGESVFQWRRS